MCIHLVVPPTLPVPAVAEPSPDKTTRERYSVHSADQCARACHELIDPVGFAFENYDAVGAFRTTENNKPVDASGSLKLGTSAINFKNAIELVGQLAKAPEVQDCMVQPVDALRPEAARDRRRRSRRSRRCRPASRRPTTTCASCWSP